MPRHDSQVKIIGDIAKAYGTRPVHTYTHVGNAAILAPRGHLVRRAHVKHLRYPLVHGVSARLFRLKHETKRSHSRLEL